MVTGYENTKLQVQLRRIKILCENFWTLLSYDLKGPSSLYQNYEYRGRPLFL